MRSLTAEAPRLTRQVDRPALDSADKKRLRGQLARIQSFYLAHPGWWTLGEIARSIGAVSEAGLSMRLRELTYEPNNWHKDLRKRAKNLWEYKLTPPSGLPAQLELI